MKKETLLVTGGTGFLGRALALRLKNEYRVVLTGRNNKQNAYASKVTGCEVVPMDIVNIEAVRDTFTEFQPSVVVHAAATKFVDLAERQPMECVDVNVLGSQNVARVCVEKGTKKVIAVSTDKAAPPVRNTYGLTKALMERVFCSMDAKTETKFASVRYGNVAWSTGSVLPIWSDMHSKTGVIGTTGPEMTRFFFTVDEAVQLVVTAIDHIDTIRGQVLSRLMKSCLIETLLDVWTTEKGGRWERIEGRPGERNLEYLIGPPELEYTRELVFDKVVHYLISFNSKSESPLMSTVDSDSAERLTRDEILKLISSPPSH